MYWLIITYVATTLQVLFLTCGLAAALYYLAELVEEYTSVAAKVINGIILAVMGIHVGFLVFEDIPTYLSVIGIVSQITHLALMNTFPCFQPFSPSFIAAFCLLIAQHYLSFKYFGENYHDFAQVLSYMCLCLWIVPFALFVSLSANDQVLPTTGPRLFPSSGSDDVVSAYLSKSKRRGKGLLSFLTAVKDAICPTASKRFS